MQRRKVIALVTGLVIAWPLACYAQQPQSGPPKRIGVLAQYGCPLPSDWVGTRRLSELGWVEGQNYVYDCVSSIGRLDQVPALARELVSRRPDVVGAAPIEFVRALQQATTTIPIVMYATAEPVRMGFITNLARPEGNVTGVAWFGHDVIPKRVELLKEIVPHLKRLAIISSAHPDPKRVDLVEENVTIAARKLGFTWQFFHAAAPNDYDKIFSRLATDNFDAAYITAEPQNNQNQLRIIELAAHHLVPAVGEGTWWTKGGLLLSYGQDYNKTVVHGAEYVSKILRGAKPSDRPVEQATQLELGINLKTAKALGITVPPALLAQADEVIE